MKNFILYVIVLSFFASCAVKPGALERIENNYTKPLSLGSSGLTQINDSTYLAVYDIKNHKKGVRLALLQIKMDEMTALPLIIDDWGAEGASSDLESVCAIPGKPNEFLAAESGNWQGKFGRIFHIKVDMQKAQAMVLHSFKVPQIHRNDFDKTGDQYEGIYCLAINPNKYWIMLGERGGSEVNVSGLIRWGIWDMVTNKFQFTQQGRKGIAVDAPGNWSDTNKKRSLTDFYVDQDNVIWTAGSEDQGDFGPFYSVLYRLGTIGNADDEVPFKVFPSLKISKEIVGFKIESIAGPAKGINSTLSIGTEDENYGGVWRPLLISAN